VFSADATGWHVVSLGSRLVILGETECDGQRVAAVWTSEDGFSWSRVPHGAVFDITPADSPDCPHGFRDVVVGGPGLVAVGVTVGADQIRKATVWTSPDGENWSRFGPDDDTELGTERSFMGGVFVGGPGLIATGSVCQAVEECQWVVWTSDDGLTWTRIEDAASSGPSNVIGGGPGFVGVSRQPEPVFWTSPDGIAWTQVPSDQVESHACFQWLGIELAASENGLAALAHCNTGSSEFNIVWTSRDGYQWSATRLDDKMRVSGLVGVGSEFVGLGSIEPDQMSDDRATMTELQPAAWLSTDGLVWTPVNLDESLTQTGRLHTATVGGPGLVAIGSSAEGPTVWVASRD
jgi:hypothetical protein